MKKLEISQMENLQGNASPFSCMALGFGSILATGSVVGWIGINYAAYKGWYQECWNS
jgi:hypothetical protein